MGHSRLGWLPQTYRWQDVVGLVAGGGSAAAVADATLVAAQRGLAGAVKDPGVRHVVWLLAHVVLAAREPNFAMGLRGLGVPVGAHPSTFELVGAVTEAVDDHLAASGGRTDFGEMAQMAAAESLAVGVGTRTATLFEAPGRDVREAVRELSTERGFSGLAQDFFSRLVRRFLNYHLSRELSCHVGGGGRFADVHDHGRFLAQLDWTCREAAGVVQTYAGQWYSTARFVDGVSPQQVGRFVETSMTKLRAELGRRGQGWRNEGDGDGRAA